MEQILYEVKRVVVGQDRFLERVMVAMLAQGHLLVEGVPGLAKTLTVKTLANTVRGQFKRIQFTPDLVPADLVGTRIYNQKTGDFSTSLGPGVHQPAAGRRNQPRAGQGAKRAAGSDAGTPGDHCRRDAQGTQPIPGHGHAEPDRDRRHLPAARSQVDRFMMKVLVDYPTDEEEFVIVSRVTGPAVDVTAVATTEQLAALQAECRRVYVDPSLVQYAVKLVSATRNPEKHGIKDMNAVHHLRRQPARHHQPDRRRAGAGHAARAHLCPARRHDRPGARRAAPPRGAVVRGAVRGPDADSLISKIMAKIPAPAKPLEHEKLALEPQKIYA
jgi:MoxR-like ATPase